MFEAWNAELGILKDFLHTFLSEKKYVPARHEGNPRNEKLLYIFVENLAYPILPN